MNIGRTEELRAALKERILILDGAMGTMIQEYRLDEKGYRGSRFADWHCDLKGHNDLLCLTKPEIIRAIHDVYISAGADIIETNTFNANAISLADYDMSDLAYEINLEAARIAKAAAIEGRPDSPVFVAGAIGPTNKTLSMSPNVSDPGYRAVDFKTVVRAYYDQARGLLDGGVDILLVETIFDTLNAKAALFAIDQLFEERDITLPLMISGTITDSSGRTLSGQTLEAFLISIQHAKPFCVGLNCALGAAEMRSYLEVLSRESDCFVHTYPNAGLPNELGGYDESPSEMCHHIVDFANAGLVNIVGGCCGTTPEHIRHMADHLRDTHPRVPPVRTARTAFSGLEPLIIRPDTNFINIGERTNVTGSRAFSKLILQSKYDEALTVALQQVEAGAQIIDINMDEALLDSEAAMRRFINLVMSEPDIARVPVMIDSSKWSVIEAGLQCVQGKSIVNSISLKEGVYVFLQQAKLARRYGAAVVVMAFDEEGQADTMERKVSICERAYRLLTGRLHFPPEDIIFDPNIFAVATGIPEHQNYAVDFIEAIRRIKEICPGVRISGGVSNLSFSFRGNDHVREAMHSAFLYHAIRAGMDMGIVNAGMIGVYNEIEPTLLRLVEDVLFNRNDDATDKLIAYAESHKNVGAGALPEQDLAWRQWPLQKRITHALVRGIDAFVAADMDEAIATCDSALQVIEVMLMSGMSVVGDLFGSGQMFLPQVVKSARVMKKSVAHLTPHIHAEKIAGNASTKGKILLATVKGDVHDIGKNIVGVVLGCNNYEVIDLGVMVPLDKIIETALHERVDIIGLSGLITPSLDEMIYVAREMQRREMQLPILIGGATTSRTHTALKIEPEYDGPVIHVLDASRSVTVASSLLSSDPEQKSQFISETKAAYADIRERKNLQGNSRRLTSFAHARSNPFQIDWSSYCPPPPCHPGLHLVRPDIDTLIPFIDWTPFFQTWELAGKYPKILEDPFIGNEAKKLLEDANALLNRMKDEQWPMMKGVVGIFPAASTMDDILVSTGKTTVTIPCLRQQVEKAAGQSYLSLCDFIAPRSQDGTFNDWIGAFAVTAGHGINTHVAEYEAAHDDYHAIMIKALADRLAEAMAEWLHWQVRVHYWGYAPEEVLNYDGLIDEKYQGIRPAPGYPACPDHTQKHILFSLLDVPNQAGIQLTEHYAMYPAASVSGWYFSHPAARYFPISKIGEDQLSHYCQRHNTDLTEGRKWLSTLL